MLGPVTSRLIPGAGLYLINVTDTLARVNATARLFRSFICVPCLPSPHRIRATCESVHGLFLTFTRVHPPGISDRSGRSFWKREKWTTTGKNFHANFKFLSFLSPITRSSSSFETRRIRIETNTLESRATWRLHIMHISCTTRRRGIRHLSRAKPELFLDYRPRACASTTIRVPSGWSEHQKFAFVMAFHVPSPPISDVNWAPTQQQSIRTKFGA